ncbi:MAG: diaminopimelate epimerase [Candidatus Methanoliparum thermophilum]|uniref:Diaminopimelate epimerase n=1 Tax=Methanoliparum thermophilum TaxID=2491083 RepID=A0A520KRD8_METT2|nr:diaminopimelate epimerase [Candidatus Methanoliparum sp. LAM-1]RZN64149.1 MAG: diaminopimelate epimerase [Candidatus Methanoliparum thermophilum]BDC35582.1 diaminopimelate epimerase [Candidatus Methanoliparum sp. LAM-1]
MISFSKLHGNGNDFILIDEFNRQIVPDNEKSSFSSKICNRHFGVGGDGVLFLSKPDSSSADLKMKIFNSDGSEAEMCGNGIRCLIKYAIDARYTDKNPLFVETLAGCIKAYYNFEGKDLVVRVRLNVPRFIFLNREFDDLVISLVNTGVPHAVIFVNDVKSVDLKKIAPKIRYSITGGCNVNFAQLVEKNRIVIRTYERGVEDETLGCGTGAVAVAVVAKKLNLVDEEVEVINLGGKLKIFMYGDLVYLEGYAFRVFDGFLVDLR